MRKLDEQWIEEIEGKMHMLKAVHPFELCQGCLFNCNQGGCCWKGFDDCQMGSFFIIRDLGPVNEDGVLAEERTGLFPVIAGIDSEKCWIVRLNAGNITITAIGNTKQEAIEAWNRRM